MSEINKEQDNDRTRETAREKKNRGIASQTIASIQMTLTRGRGTQIKKTALSTVHTFSVAIIVTMPRLCNILYPDPRSLKR